MIQSSTWMPLISFSMKMALRWLTTGMIPARIFASAPASPGIFQVFHRLCREHRLGQKAAHAVFQLFFGPAQLYIKLRAFRFRAPNTVMGPGISRPSPASETMYWASLRELNW